MIGWLLIIFIHVLLLGLGLYLFFNKKEKVSETTSEVTETTDVSENFCGCS